MTQPTQMNCAHQSDGWCLSCVALLEAENATLKLDAERYQWLRYGDNDEEVIKKLPSTGESFLLRTGSLDAAIDAAIAKESKDENQPGVV